MTDSNIPDGGKVHASAWSTEQEAALLQTSERKAATYRRILSSLRVSGGSTDDELRHQLWGVVSKSGPATRRGELVEMGLVRPQRLDPDADTDASVGPIVKRPSDLGNPMIVWELVPADEYVAPEPTSAERQPNAAGLAIAREVADWQMGEPGLANEILRAYLNPKQVADELARERGEF